MACLLCGSEQKKIFDRAESFGYPLVYYQCENCGLVFQSQEESEAADPEFYATTYRKIYQAHEEPTAKDLWVQGQRSQHLIANVRQSGVKAVANMLDIGASAGVLLETFHQAFDCKITGVEPGEATGLLPNKRESRCSPAWKTWLQPNPNALIW